MIRKTMRIGEVRTSIKLEAEFWAYLKEIADARKLRLSMLVNEVAQLDPERANLASQLRTYALTQARERSGTLRRKLDELSLGGSGRDLIRLLEACPMPLLLLDDMRAIKAVNRAFTQWLNLDAKATLGQRIENIMILRGQGLREMWGHLLDGRLPRGAFNATYVSPGKVRTSQAVAVPIGEAGDAGRRGFALIFETLAARA